jgi:N-ethylmaleimide reductase
MKKLLTPFKKGSLSLKNHLVMAPMTRSRAINNLPNDLMAEYYGQRTGAGLIITEGTAPTPEALGYPRIPGVFNELQIEGWKKTTSAVHKDGTKIFLQLMHTGRIGHNDNLPEGVKLVGASKQKAAGQIFTDTLGMQDHSEPTALTTKGVKLIIEGFKTAAKNAIAAGFDGIELHAANGYLLEQFLNPNVNNRTDEYGGSIEKRAKLIIDTAKETFALIGKEKVGIRFSPFSTLGDLQAYNEEEVHDTYAYLAKELNAIDIAYIHISSNPNIPQKTLDIIRANFNGTLILSSGLTPETAEQALYKGIADLVAFGRSFLSNPDFEKRIEKSTSLNQVDFTTLYTPGAVGYTDYARL